MSSRFVTSVLPGITSWHSFSAGAHYDPDNVAFGPVIGLDEHVVEGGAGFDWHAHRGVFIVSRVLEGTLRHEDSSGVVRLIKPGEFLVQSTGDGVRHSETNASDERPLRFLQLTLLGSEGTPRVWQQGGRVEVDGTVVELRKSVPDHAPLYVFMLDSGDDRRMVERGHEVPQSGDVLVVELPGAASGNRQ